MNTRIFDQNNKINAQNEQTAWINFVKSGSVRDYLVYFECKGASSFSRQEEINNAYSSEWNNNRGNRSK